MRSVEEIDALLESLSEQAEALRQERDSARDAPLADVARNSTLPLNNLPTSALEHMALVSIGRGIRDGDGAGGSVERVFGPFTVWVSVEFDPDLLPSSEQEG